MRYRWLFCFQRMVLGLIAQCEALLNVLKRVGLVKESEVRGRSRWWKERMR